MATPFIGEIRLFGGWKPPDNWSVCDGKLLPIADHETLFNLIGTTYGGDGDQFFAVPDLRSRVPVGSGPGYAIGTTGGAEQVRLTIDQMTLHAHVPLATNDFGQQSLPSNLTPARSTASDPYGSDTGAALAMNGASYAAAGGDAAHENRQPYLALTFIISLAGIYPHQAAGDEGDEGATP